jgi:hypothetical protein
LIEIEQNIFSIEDADAICITTNGFVKRSGAAVMGAGVAKQAKERWRWIDYTLGETIELLGNTATLLTVEREGVIVVREPYFFTTLANNVAPYHIVSFPVKPAKGVCDEFHSNVVIHSHCKYSPGQEVPGWHMKADLELIRQSAKKLVAYVDFYEWKKVVVPAPDCGNGERKWSEIQPILESFFDDRFFISFFG